MLQLAVYEAAATFDVVDVAAVIDAPVAQVAVGGQVALYGICLLYTSDAADE